MINMYIIKQLESVSKDKILIKYEVPELIRKLDKKLVTKIWQKTHVNIIME